MSPLRRWWAREFTRLLFTGSPPTDAAASTSGPQLERRRPRRGVVHQRSLFGEIFDWMFAPLLLIWPVSITITFIAARAIADRPYDLALTAHARMVTEQVRVVNERVILPLPLLEVNKPGEKVDADEPEAPESKFEFQVSTQTGEVLAGLSDLPRPALFDFPEPGRIKLRNAIYRGEEVRVAYSYYYSSSDADSPTVLIQIMEGQEARTQLANQIIKSVILPQFLILPIAGLLVWYGLSRGLAPLQSMQRRIRDRKPDDPSPIDPAGVPQEISPLVESFNELLVRLTASVEAQKQFVADAAHQIKTPLAGLRTHVELTLRQTDPAEIKAGLAQLALGTERATRLVNQLLSLARTDAQRAPLPLEPLNLTSLAREAASEWVSRALSRRGDLGFESDGRAAHVLGHPMLLQELLSNLIDNALNYSKSDAVVTVRVLNTERSVLLEVEDNGPGIPESERSRVFDRFYRVLGTGIEGSGLGLAIVKEIAEMHGAAISLYDTHPGSARPGLRVQIEFGRTRPPER